MWIKKLKKKKLQFIIIGIILAFATSILTAFTIMALDVESYTKKEFSEEINSKYYLVAEKGTGDIISEKSDSNIEDICIYNSCYESLDISSKKTLEIYHNEININEYDTGIYIIALDDNKGLNWKVTPKEGILDDKYPKEGEIWIQKITADNNNIKVGDYYYIGKDRLKVSSIVNDVMKPNSLKSGQTIYINEKDYGKFGEKSKTEFVCFNSKYNSNEMETWLKANVSNKFKVHEVISLKNQESIATMANLLAASTGILAAIFMLIVTIVIIRFFIRNNILQEYSAIGIYKAVGFTSKEIMGFYKKCYLVTALIAIVIGGIIGIPVSVILGNIALEYIGEYSLSITSITVPIIIAIVIILILQFNVWLSLKKIKKISPVDALRVGTASSKEKLNKSIIKNAHSSLTMAINEVFKYKRKSLLIVLVITVSFYISLVFLNMYNSINTIDEKASSWVGIPTCNCIIQTKDKEIPDDLLDYVAESKYVDKYVYGSFGINAKVEDEDNVINFRTPWKLIYNTYDKENYNINYSEGRPPEYSNEIGIGSANIKNTKYKVGDYITLKIDNKEDTFLITGRFDTVGEDGGIHFLNSYFEEQRDLVYKTSIAVKLNDKDDYKKFKEEINEKFPGYEIAEMNDLVGDIKKSITTIMLPITASIVTIFIVFTLLNIINLNIMNINEQKRNYGIMKAYGFTTGYIIRKNIFRVSILSAVGLGMAVLLNSLITRKIFWMSLGCDGYNLSIPYTLTLIIGGLILIILSTLILSNSIRKVSPKDLIDQ